MNIQVKNLCKNYKENMVLKNVNLTFEKGKITCIMGASGCGKTTLLSILLGIVKADAGEIIGIDDEKISVVFQENRLCEAFTVRANIELISRRKIPLEEIIDNLRQVALEEVVEKRVAKLSGGMKRRVAIVRAIMADSNIIIMDEPFKGLDEKTKITVIEYIKKNAKNKTLIITTHNKDEVIMLESELIKMK